MSKVLFFNIAAHGHTYPTLPLVAELVRRGEEVIYYSTGSAFQQAIEGTGATFRNSATPLLNDETQIDNDKSDFYRTCFEAFANSNRQVVLSVGKRTNIGASGPIPDNFIVKAFVPQLEVLQRASLFITHGGMNSVSEALYYGVPLVVIPQTADQNLVSQRIAQLGAGKVLRRSRITAQKLRETAEAVLAQPRFQQASARIGKSFGAADGYSKAVTEILEFKRLQGI